MKQTTWSAIAFLVFSLVCLPRARATDVNFVYQDCTQTVAPVRSMALFPLWFNTAPQTFLPSSDRIFRFTGTNGSVVISNTLGGAYRAEFYGIDTTTTNWFWWPDTNVLLQASQWPSTNYLTWSSVPGYSTAQADLTFWSKSGLAPGSGLTPSTNNGVVSWSVTGGNLSNPLFVGSTGPNYYSWIGTNSSLGIWAGFTLGIDFPWAGGAGLPSFMVNSNGVFDGIEIAGVHTTGTNGVVTQIIKVTGVPGVVGDISGATGLTLGQMPTGFVSNNAVSVPALAIGTGATASGGSQSIAYGGNSAASGSTATAVGYAANAQNSDTSAFGNGAMATANNATAIGYSANASAQQATAVGEASTSAFTHSTALGVGSASDAINEVMLGTSADTVVVPGNFNLRGQGNGSGMTNLNLSTAQIGSLPVQGIFGNYNMDKVANVIGQLIVLGKLRILTIGDSTGDYIISGTAPYWEGQIGLSGFIGAGLSPYDFPTVINIGSSATINNGGGFTSTNWWSIHYALSNTASLLYSGAPFYTPSVSGNKNTNIYSDTICVMWANRPGAGSFKIQTSTNGSAFGTINTISTANATASLQITNIFLGKGQYSFQVTGTGGGDGYAEIIMAGAYLTNSPGLFHLSMSGSGVDYTGYTSSSSNFQAKVMQFANPDVVIMESRHPAAYPFYIMNQISNALGGNVPIVLVGEYAACPAGDIPAMLALSTNNWQMAVTNGYSFLDCWTPMHDTNKMNLIGFYVGSPNPSSSPAEVHLNQAGIDFQGALFMRAMGFNNNLMDSSFTEYASQNGLRDGILNGFSQAHVGFGTPDPIGHFDFPVSYSSTISHIVFDTAKDSFWPGIFFTPDSAIPGGKLRISPDTTQATAFLNTTNAALLMFLNGVALNAPQGGQIFFGRPNYDISSQVAGEVGMFDSTHDFNIGGYLWRFFASSGQSNSRKTGAGWANIQSGLTVGASTSSTNVNAEFDNTGQFWIFNNASTNLLVLNSSGNLNVRSNINSSATISATNGFASISASTASVNATGYTNNMSINGQAVDVEVIFSGGTSVLLKDSGATTRHTYTSGPTNASVILKPGWAVTGTAMSGDVISQ